jgi:hypothetical protein
MLRLRDADLQFHGIGLQQCFLVKHEPTLSCGMVVHHRLLLPDIFGVRSLFFERIYANAE